MVAFVCYVVLILVHELNPEKQVFASGGWTKHDIGIE